MLWNVLLHVIVGVLFAVLAAWAYATVLPEAVALLLGITLGALEIIAPLVARHGITARLLFRAGLPLLTWPAFGLLFEHILPGRSWTTSMVLASILASATGFSTRSHAQGRDSQGRIIESIVAVGIPLYAIVYALVFDAGPVTMALAAAGGTVACMVAYQSRTWPGRHETALLIGAGVCAVTAGAWLVAATVWTMV